MESKLIFYVKLWFVNLTCFFICNHIKRSPPSVRQNVISYNNTIFSFFIWIKLYVFLYIRKLSCTLFFYGIGVGLKVNAQTHLAPVLATAVKVITNKKLTRESFFNSVVSSGIYSLQPIKKLNLRVYLIILLGPYASFIIYNLWKKLHNYFSYYVGILSF